MKTIYKYELNKRLTVPYRSIVRKAGMQDGSIYIWVEVNLKFTDTKAEHEFRVFGTGENIPEYFQRYVDTVFDGPFVWHIYQRDLF